MTSTAFKDLVIDAADADRMANFWSAALGLQAAMQESGDAVITDSVPEHTIWINRVPEAKMVKQRVHLDLHVGDVAEMIALGATVQAEHGGWTVMLDPEQGEFCAFPRDRISLPGYRLYELVVDADDPAALCAWWGERLGIAPQHDPDEPWHWLEGGSLPWEMVFNPVQEPKTVKNRIHFDVWGDTRELLDAGATLLRAKDAEIDWDIIADPEGNEVCVFARS